MDWFLEGLLKPVTYLELACFWAFLFICIGVLAIHLGRVSRNLHSNICNQGPLRGSSRGGLRSRGTILMAQ